MSVLSKILDKLGLHREKEQSIVTGTTEVAPPDPLTTTPTPASKAVLQEEPVPPARRKGGPAPISEEGDKGNTEKLR